METREERVKRLQKRLDQQELNLRNLNPKRGIVKRNIEHLIVGLKEEMRKTEYGDPVTWDKNL